MESNVMESPLDVLSRAASMVETTCRTSEACHPVRSSVMDLPFPSYPRHDSGVDLRASPGKQLPGLAARHDRVHRRMLGPLGEDDDGYVRKSTSTQTQFSSFNCESLPPPPYYSNHDISQDRPLPPPPPLHQYTHTEKVLPGSSSLLPPHHQPPHLSPPNPHSHISINFSSSSSPAAILPKMSSEYLSSHHPPSPPPLPPYPISYRNSPPHYNDLCQPLNLSLSHSSSPTPGHDPSRQGHDPSPASRRVSSGRLSPPPLPLHPSVPPTRQGVSSGIQTPPPPPMPSSRLSPPVAAPHPTQMAMYKDGPRTTPSHSDRADPTNSASTKVSDEAIEEHFRRSLGTSYTEVSPVKVKSASDVDERKCTGTSSVDDHFARALGDKTWTEIKSKSEAQSSDNLPGTVDDHFAKALGASTWKKLRAETQIDPSPSQESHRQQPQQAVTPPSNSSLHRPLAT